MKLPPTIKLTLVSLVLAPVFGLWGIFLVGISAHSGGILWIMGLCMAPGLLVTGWVPDDYLPPFVVGVEFFVIFGIGLLFLKFRARLNIHIHKAVDVIYAKLFGN